MNQKSEIEPTVWDKDAMVRRVLGREDLVNTLINVFLGETMKRLSDLVMAINQADTEQAHFLAHSIKGTAGNISGLRVQQQAALMEEAAKSADMDTMISLLPGLQQEMQQLKQCFEQHLAAQNDTLVEESSSIDKQQFASKLQALQAMLKRSDYIDAKELAVLQQAGSDPAIASLLDRLLVQVNQFENNAALKTINEIAEAAAIPLGDTDSGVGPQGNKALILVVDDMPANIQVLAACLRDKYHIRVAKTGQQCLQLASLETMPDLILLDIEMPGMDGYEVCRRLKADSRMRSIPVIFVTGKGEDDEEEHGLQLGAVDYITKPVRPGIVAARVKTQITLKQQHDKLEMMALHDQLTGLYNRHYLLEVSNNKVARAMRHKYGLSLLMLDIDHFKAINDGHGHPVGDLVLQSVARLVRQQTRQEDIATRFGGEEFVILLDQCDLALAESKAEALREMIEALQPEGITVTASIGVAQLIPGKEIFSGLLKRADLAVYKAKAEGRNRVVVV